MAVLCEENRASSLCSAVVDASSWDTDHCIWSTICKDLTFRKDRGTSEPGVFPLSRVLHRAGQCFAAATWVGPPVDHNCGFTCWKMFWKKKSVFVIDGQKHDTVQMKDNLTHVRLSAGRRRSSPSRNTSPFYLYTSSFHCGKQKHCESCIRCVLAVCWSCPFSIRTPKQRLLLPLPHTWRRSPHHWIWKSASVAGPQRPSWALSNERFKNHKTNRGSCGTNIINACCCMWKIKVAELTSHLEAQHVAVLREERRISSSSSALVEAFLWDAD